MRKLRTKLPERALKKTRVLFTVAPEIFKAAREESNRSGVSLSHVVEIALKKWVSGEFIARE